MVVIEKIEDVIYLVIIPVIIINALINSLLIGMGIYFGTRSSTINIFAEKKEPVPTGTGTDDSSLIEAVRNAEKNADSINTGNVDIFANAVSSLTLGLMNIEELPAKKKEEISKVLTDMVKKALGETFNNKDSREDRDQLGKEAGQNKKVLDPEQEAKMLKGIIKEISNSN